MSSLSAAGSGSSNRPDSTPPTGATTTAVHPLLRTTLRYTLSAKEYKLLHDYLVKRSPTAVQKRFVSPQRYEALYHSSSPPSGRSGDGKSSSRGGDDYNAAAVRAALRVFLAASAGLKAWDVISGRLAGKAAAKTKSNAPTKALSQSPSIFRLPISLSLLLLLHRLLHRFFTRLRANLLTDSAAPFRRRNPRVSRTLTSRLAPAVGASLAGFALGVYPSDQLRLTVAIYAASRALEWGYNALVDLADEDGEGVGSWVKRHKPGWVGSWMLFPLAEGQLLHAFVFDRDCFPSGYGDFILKYTPNYIQKRPESYPATLAWPGTYEIIDSLAEMARLNWPPFVSPILHPNKPSPLPSASLTKIFPITSPAHPGIPYLSCALLHPSTPSCFSAYLTHILISFPRLARFFTIVFALFSLPRYRLFLAKPLQSLNALASGILRITTVVCGAIGTSWASICLFQNVLPRRFLPRGRFFLGGFLGGLFALVDRKAGRNNWLYGARTSADSLWKVGVKHGWWKARRGGDVLVFVASLMLINIVYELRPRAVDSGMIRKAIGMFTGEGWVDRVERLEKAEAATAAARRRTESGDEKEE